MDAKKFKGKKLISIEELIKEDALIISPEAQRLKEEVDRARAELMALLLERDELKYVICKNIEMRYMLELGGLEYKVYQLECSWLRKKRKIELIQMRKNRQETIDIYEIEAQLDKEFEEYLEALEDHLAAVNDAIDRSKGELLTTEESAEFKKMYRSIVKALHPDLNPNITPEQIKLFQRAVEAYENTDVETLKVIHEMVDGMTIPESWDNPIAKLKEDKSRLDGLIKGVVKGMESIKADFPYNMRDLLNDEDKLETKRQELNELYQEYKEAIEIMEIRIKVMLGEENEQYS